MKSLRIGLVASIFLMSLAASADNVTFSYEGRVKVNGSPFNGTGQFKFAVMNTSATTTLWSNDGTLSGQPTAFVSLAVSEGVFSVVVGDASLGMVPINSSVFASHTPLKLRVWFNSGLGFQQLNPDQNLVDLTLNTITTGDTSYNIYVDGTLGNDANNGLTIATAKKTVQGGVDIVPSHVRCDVKIIIAAGIYREVVLISGISVDTSKSLTLVGDTGWSPTSSDDPNVRITGSDAVADSVPVRDIVLAAMQCSGLGLKGILFDHGKSGGVYLANGVYTVDNCKSTSNTSSSSAFFGFASSDTGFGFMFAQQSYGTMTKCLATGNSTVGIYAIQGGLVQLFDSSSDYNNSGIFANTLSLIQCKGIGHFSHNTADGVDCLFQSTVTIQPGYSIQFNLKGFSANGLAIISASGATVNSNTNANTTFNGALIF